MIPPVARRPIAGMQAPAAQNASMQMAAQRQAFMGMGPQGPTPQVKPGNAAEQALNPTGKRGLINYGGMTGANADAIKALDSGAGHML